MGATISVAADGIGASAVLLGTFDTTNRWFLAKHLQELDGDVVIDLEHVECLDDASIAALREFSERAADERRRVMFRSMTPELLAALTDDRRA